VPGGGGGQRPSLWPAAMGNALAQVATHATIKNRSAPMLLSNLHGHPEMGLLSGLSLRSESAYQCSVSTCHLIDSTHQHARSSPQALIHS